MMCQQWRIINAIKDSIRSQQTLLKRDRTEIYEMQVRTNRRRLLIRDLKKDLAEMRQIGAEERARRKATESAA